MRRERGVSKNRFKVITWNNKRTMLPKGKVALHHLVGRYYIARIGLLSLLNLDYCVYFFRPVGGGKNSGGRAFYNLLKKPYANSAMRSKSCNMKQGMLGALTRGTSLRILLRQIPKKNATNVPAHRHDYQLIAVCLVGADGEIIDIDARSHPRDQY